MTRWQHFKSKQLAAVEMRGGTCGLIGHYAINLTTFYFLYYITRLLASERPWAHKDITYHTLTYNNTGLGGVRVLSTRATVETRYTRGYRYIGYRYIGYRCVSYWYIVYRYIA